MKRIDWLDFGHQIFKERERLQDELPPGLHVHLSLSCYGDSGASYYVTLRINSTGLEGWGSGTTPTKALEDAKAKLQARHDEQQRRPRLVAPKDGGQ